MDLEITKEGDQYLLSGWINERSDLSELHGPASVPLKLVLEGLQGMNSTGTATFIKLMRAAPGRPIELHECPRWFIDMSNAMPQLLGGRGAGRRVASLFIPHACESCSRHFEALVATKNVKAGLDVAMPRVVCDGCGQSAKPTIDPHDYLLFLIDDAA